MPSNDSETRLKQVEGIIWDLDNTLYRFDKDFEHLCHVAAAKAAVKGGVPMTHEETLKISLKSYDQYGHSYRLLIEQYELDKQQMHYDFHSFIDETLIKKSVELIDLFSKVNLNHVLVTHASGEWAQRALAHIGLKDFFPDERIIPAEATNFQSKAESRAPFEEALSRLSLSPEKVVVAEDITENLRIPHEMGLGTILVHYGKPPSPIPDYVDMNYNNAALFLERLLS